MEKVLPRGWVETEFVNLIAHVIGGDWGKYSDYDEKDFVKVYCIRGSEIKSWNSNFGDTAVVRKIKKSSLDSRRLINGDILLEISGGGPDQPVGRVVLITQNTFNRLSELPIVCTNFLRLIRPVAQINSRYFCSYLEYFYYSGEVVKYQGGSNNLRNLKYKEYETIRIPFPPLAEQERIVAKLDKLFAQHEKIKKALDRIPQLLKTFRQQVLTQAVTGKLTEQWREGKKLKEWNPTLKKHNTKNLLDDKSQGYVLPEIPKEWKWVTIMQLADVKGGKRLPKGEKLVNYDTGFPYIKAGDIKNGNVNSVNLEYLLEATHEKIKNYIVNSGDILITNVGACIGDIGIVPTNLNGANQTENALKLCNFVEVQVRYLSFWLISPIAQNYISQTVLSAGLGKLALGRIQVFPVPLSTIVEQQEIVRRVESFFAKADVIETRYQTLKANIGNLPQALLHKAFKGELVSQLPTDGDAKNLLAEIMALKAETKRNK